MKTKEELLNSYLPKWPQMIVTGVPVTEEQALEIIRRTDTFFSWDGGNNHRFKEEVKRILEIPQYPDRCNFSDEREWNAAFDECSQKREEWFEKWQYISTEYVTNSWISCDFIGGPHGWVHPDGTIGYADNVGKWPEVQEVYEEWRVLAKAFPFVELGITLMNGESGEENIQPVVSFVVKNGEVEIVNPAVVNVHEGHAGVEKVDVENYILTSLFRAGSENAIPMETIRSWRKFL